MEQDKPIDIRVYDPAPDFIGNEDIKRILLYAFARYNANDRKTVVPIIVIGRAGSGKTYLLNVLAKYYPADIFNKDALTPASLGMKDRGKVVKVRFECLSLFDEIDKWSFDKLSVMLPIFGAEEITRVRSATKINIRTKTLPIGTLLWGWRELMQERMASGRTQIIEQILRRSCILHLKPPTHYAREVYAETVLHEFFGTDIEDVLKSGEKIKRVYWLLSEIEELSKGDVYIAEEEIDAIKELLVELGKKVYISDYTDYSAPFQKIVTNLAIGKAFTELRDTVIYKDFEHIASILMRHLNELGMVVKEEEEKRRKKGRQRKS